ncbi:MAG: FKBP-type peptidyl-prolyl cis-trans isomerase [Aureispira sp.]
MKYVKILLLVGLFLTSTIGKGQNKDQYELAYHYGVVTGYELQNRQITVQQLPVAALIRGMEAYQAGTPKVSIVEAEEVRKTTLETPTKASLETLGYAYGVLIGSNWKTYELVANTTNLAAFKEGVEQVFSTSKMLLSEEAAQLKVMQACKQLLAEKMALQVKANQAFLDKNKERPEVLVLENGLQYELLEKGKGATIGVTNKRLKIQYRGTLRDGTVFEEAMEVPALITRKTVLAGWKSILPLMRKGQTLKIYIPPSLGYGEQARGMVPANSILIYEMTLLGVLE